MTDRQTELNRQIDRTISIIINLINSEEYPRITRKLDDAFFELVTKVNSLRNIPRRYRDEI